MTKPTVAKMPTVAKIWFSEERQRWEGVCDNTSDLHHNGSLVDLKAEFAQAFGLSSLWWEFREAADGGLTLLGRP